jgi:3-deoxy-manno-octulosonate cytidylyltransferase (CMP-KDO synthetase)
MNIAIVIPARFASQRLPAKPLLRETGKYLIQHVYERACQSGLANRAIVATDDQRIFDAVQEFGGEVWMTRIDHASGTDRIAEVVADLDADILVNLQGDEPLFDPEHLDLLARSLMDNPTSGMATLATPFRDETAWRNPNFVKVVCDDSGRAMYFSRSPIPMCRDGEPDFAATPPLYLQHLGVYAYRRETLLKLASTPPHPIELSEKLEQLRALAHGIGIQVGVIPHAHRGVDTPEDYAAFVAAYRG